MNPFKEKENQPTTQTLANAFGPAYGAFEAICLHARGFTQSWNWAKYSGWVLKAADKKKALFYLLPGEDSFALSMALRENERDTLAALPQLAFAKETLDTAKHYREGWAVQLPVTEITAENVILFLDELIRLRTA